MSILTWNISFLSAFGIFYFKSYILLRFQMDADEFFTLYKRKFEIKVHKFLRVTS